MDRRVVVLARSTDDCWSSTRSVVVFSYPIDLEVDQAVGHIPATSPDQIEAGPGKISCEYHEKDYVKIAHYFGRRLDPMKFVVHADLAMAQREKALENL